MAQFRFGNFDFPDRLIELGGVESAPNQRQSLDPYTDMIGLTHDIAAPHTKSNISFKTLPMSSHEMREIMSGLVSNYIDYGKRDAMCTYWDDENGEFKTGHFYLDKSLKFNREEVGKDGIPTKYGEMDWTFIEY